MKVRQDIMPVAGEPGLFLPSFLEANRSLTGTKCVRILLEDCGPY